MNWIDEVLHFWFEALKPKQWWGGSDDVDATIATRFGALRERLAAAPPDPAMLDARGHLAAVIVFDQFPRNLFRGSARAFATDAIAQAIALDAIDRALDAPLTSPQRQFLYMPLMHAENAELQRRAVALYETLGAANGLASATKHRDTIERFGRFPYRNAALGRASTEAERAFLVEHPGPE